MAEVMEITIEKADGSTDTVTILPKTIVAFERQYGTGLGAIKDSGKMEYIYWLAWDAESTKTRLSGGATKLFDDWLETVATVDVKDDVPTPLSVGATPTE